MNELLTAEEPNGSFHDAHLIGAGPAIAGQRFELDFELCVGDPDSTSKSERERRRNGRLIVDELGFG